MSLIKYEKKIFKFFQISFSIVLTMYLFTIIPKLIIMNVSYHQITSYSKGEKSVIMVIGEKLFSKYKAKKK